MRKSSAFYINCLLLFFSCTEKQDFDQVKDLEIITNVSGPIVYLESTEAFINNTTIPNFLTQNMNFDIFETNFVADRIISGSITFQIENTTSKELALTIDFLDKAGSIIDSEFFLINAAPPLVAIRREIFYGPPSERSIEIVKNISGFQLGFVNNSGTTSVSSLPLPKVVIKSMGSFKLALIE